MADSGPGFSDPPEVLLDESEGVGLSTTKRRLDTLYGEAHALELGPAPDGGARVTIRIPCSPRDTLFPSEKQREAPAAPAPSA